jgi:hypothetical protein
MKTLTMGLLISTVMATAAPSVVWSKSPTKNGKGNPTPIQRQQDQQDQQEDYEGDYVTAQDHYELEEDYAAEGIAIKGYPRYHEYYNWCDNLLENVNESMIEVSYLAAQGKYVSALKILEGALKTLPSSYPKEYLSLPTYRAIVRVKAVGKLVRERYGIDEKMAQSLLFFYEKGIEMISEVHSSEISRCFTTCGSNPFTDFAHIQLSILANDLLTRKGGMVFPYGDPEIFLTATEVFLRGVAHDIGFDMDRASVACARVKINRILGRLKSQGSLNRKEWFDLIGKSVISLRNDLAETSCGRGHH